MTDASICEYVSELSPHIRYAGLHNMSGHLICGGYKKGATNTLPTKDLELVTDGAILSRHAHMAGEPYFGKEKFTLIEFEKIRAILVPIDENKLLAVSLEISADHDFIINKILNYLRAEPNN